MAVASAKVQIASRYSGMQPFTHAKRVSGFKLLLVEIQVSVMLIVGCESTSLDSWPYYLQVFVGHTGKEVSLPIAEGDASSIVVG